MGSEVKASGSEVSVISEVKASGSEVKASEFSTPESLFILIFSFLFIFILILI